MLTDTRFHRRSNPQGLMNPHEVVPHVENRQHVNVILKLLAKGISQSRKAPHAHSHVQVLPLDIAGNGRSFGAQTQRRAVR